MIITFLAYKFKFCYTWTFFFHFPLKNVTFRTHLMYIGLKPMQKMEKHGFHCAFFVTLPRGSSTMAWFMLSHRLDQIHDRKSKYLALSGYKKANNEMAVFANHLRRVNRFLFMEVNCKDHVEPNTVQLHFVSRHYN